jgi:predicted transcriptional regulator
MATKLSIELDDEALAILNKTVELSGLDRGALVSRAIKAMEHLYQQRAAAVKVAMAESEAGLGRPAEDYFKELENRIIARIQKDAA